MFIIGCGRSGTTVLGRTLSVHPAVTYLGEPRKLWASAYPQTDIWSAEAPGRQGKLHLTAADAPRSQSMELRRLFWLETTKAQKTRLVEKLPINTFRIRFIQQIFPEARFVHIYRNALEVARSIAKASENGGWFGVNAYKWDQLVEYALSASRTEELPALCSTPRDKGLLEWRLSTEAAVEALEELPDDVSFELSYAELMEHPVRAVSAVLDFAELDPDPAVEDFARHNIRRRTSQLDLEDASANDRRLGGELLPLSMGHRPLRFRT